MAVSSEIVTDPNKRLIRSYVRREGRMTRAQERALAGQWADYGVATGTGLLAVDTLFPRPAPLVLDIGPGMGLTTVTLASQRPEFNYLAVEVHRPGLGSLLHHASRAGLRNIRVICGDAVDVIRSRLPESSLDEVLILFPDPWPKKRHHKRRLLNPGFARLLLSKLKDHGRLYIATDWRDYAEMIPAVFEGNGYLNLAGERRWLSRPRWRPLTKFEQRGLKRGHSARDFAFTIASSG